jgi:hypothetical protein
VFVGDTAIIWTPCQGSGLQPFLKFMKEMKEWKNNGLGKSALQMKVPHTLYKGTHE